MDQRNDYQEAQRTKERLYEEHGKGNTRIYPKDQVRQRRSQQFSGTEEGSERVDPRTGWRWFDHPSTSTSSSSWQAASWWIERYCFLTDSRCFAYRQWRCTQDTKPARNVTFPRFFSHSVLRESCQCLSASLTCVTHACGSPRVTAQVTMECCPHKNICLHTSLSMAHSTPSLMIPPSLNTCSLLTCTPIRPSTRPSTGPPQISSFDVMNHCDDPINVSFGSLADLHLLTTWCADWACVTSLMNIPQMYT